MEEIIEQMKYLNQNLHKIAGIDGLNEQDIAEIKVRINRFRELIGQTNKIINEINQNGN